MGYTTAMMISAPEVAAIPSQFISRGFCFINLIPIKAARAGAEAIKIPTLLNSKLAIANMKNRFADISQAPESSAYLRQFLDTT